MSKATVHEPRWPSRATPQLLARTEVPLLEPGVPEEREGTVPDVVSPTAIRLVGGRLFVFYGMADAAISGVGQK